MVYYENEVNEMQRFGSTLSAKFNALFFLLLFGGMVSLMMIVPYREIGVAGTLTFGLLAVFAGWMAGTNLLCRAEICG